MRRSLLHRAGIALAFFTLTCTDRAPLGPARRGATTFDLATLLARAPGDPPVPFDSVRLTVSRTSDETILADTTVALAGFAGTGDAAQLHIAIDMQQTTETVSIVIAVTGAGGTWYTGSTTATLIANRTVTAAPVTLTYVGLGFDADSVRIQMPLTRLIGGVDDNVTAAVWVPGGILTGVPVGYRVANPAVATLMPLGINAVRITGAVPVHDSTWLYAETPTHLRDSVRVVVVPPPAQLRKISGDLQTVIPDLPLAQPLVVRVLDALGGGFRGSTVTWSVTAGAAQLSLAATITDDSGYAAITVTPTAIGPLVIEAAVPGLAGSPQLFTGAGGGGGPANVGVVAGDGQAAPVGALVPVPPAVRVTNAALVPLADVTVVFAVASGGGGITGPSTVTDASGVATVGSWTLGTTAGPNGLTATVSGLAPVTISATGIPGPTSQVVVVSGDGQTAEAGTLLSASLVVEVRDPYDNLMPGVTVTWAASHGSVTPGSITTNAAGRAQTAWTLGLGAIGQTATATVSGLPPAVFNATATFATPSILLALAGGNRVPVPGSRDLQVALTAPAPAGGLTVSVTSDSAAIVRVGSPGSVFIAQGQSSGTIALDGAGQGTTIVHANAAGYVEGTLSVIASIQVLSMPTTLNVAYGGNVSVPLTISAAAPAGGIQVGLVSSNPAIVNVLTPTVTIPQGSTIANGTVSGVLPGTVTLTGSTADFGTAQSTVSTTASFNIIETSATLNESFGTAVTIRFESQGVAAAAPAPGIIALLTAADPGCVSVPTTVTIPTGLVQTTAVLSYGGVTPTPCTTAVTASATNITSDVINVTVNPRPAISLNAVAVGSGLQESTSGSLAAAAPAGGVTVRITSLDPSVALVSRTDSTPGTAFIDVPMSQGATFFAYYVQGVEGVTGTATVSATSPVYSDGTAPITVRQAALDVIFLGATTTTLSPHTAFAVRIGVVNAAGTAFTAEQGVRAGGTAVTATLTSTAPAVGQLVTTAQTGGVVTVDVGVRQSRSAGTVATGGVAFDPLTAGTTTIAATIPGFVALPGATVVVTVSAPAINLNALAVGAGLQESASGSLGAAVPVGGLTIRITSSNPDVVLISPNATTPGTAFIDVTVNQGASFFTYYVQGVEDTSGTVTVTAKAPGYTDGTETVTVRQPALDIIFLPSTTTVGAANILFEVRIGVPNAGFTAYTAEQAIRAGGLAVTATVTTSAPGVAQLVTTALTGGTVTVVIAGGQSRSPGTVALGGVAFHPLALGTTNVGATIPGFFALPGALIPVTVNP